jgi:acyl transferase domain-containing protein
MVITDIVLFKMIYLYILHSSNAKGCDPVSEKVAVLFPGQGAYYGGVLQEIDIVYPQIKAVFSEIDQVAKEKLGQSVSEVLFLGGRPEIQEMLESHSDVLQLALYGIAVAGYKILEAQGFRPSLLIGHSFGEIAALVCGGAFTIAQGAEIVCHRIAALNQLGPVPGSMLAIGTDLERAQHLVALLRQAETVVSVENHAGQVVVSGPDSSIALLHELCRVLNLSSVALHSPYPFHNPMLTPAVKEFAVRLKQIRQAPLQLPVFSPILGRTYTDDDDLCACLAEHLIRPVHFPAAIQHAYEEGVRLFVEAGAKDTLSKLTQKVLKGEEGVITIPLLDPAQGEKASFERATSILRERGLLALASATEGQSDLLEQFWTTHGPRIVGFIQQELAAFVQQQATRVHAGAEVLAASVVQKSAKPSREQLFKELVAFYAEALEYPEEVFTEDVALEAELGVDSVKQTELMARVSERYALPPRPADFRLSNYPTMGKIADFVFDMMSKEGNLV